MESEHSPFYFLYQNRFEKNQKNIERINFRARMTALTLDPEVLKNELQKLPPDLYGFKIDLS